LGNRATWFLTARWLPLMKVDDICAASHTPPSASGARPPDRPCCALQNKRGKARSARLPGNAATLPPWGCRGQAVLPKSRHSARGALRSGDPVMRAAAPRSNAPVIGASLIGVRSPA
jgi:hypothetical protein